MTEATFQKSNIAWRVQQLSAQASEWIELQLSQQRASDAPPITFPDWVLPEVVLRVLFWLLIGAIALWALWQVFQLLQPYRYLLRNPRQSVVQAAPTETQRSLADWLRQANEFQQQGNYAEACRALYMAMLHGLDETKRLPDERSRTDGEFLNAVQAFERPEPYQLLIRTHEQLCFGNAAISSDRFKQCQQAYREIAPQ